MPGGRAAQRAGFIAVVWSVSRDSVTARPLRMDHQLFGMLLVEAQAGAAADNPQPQIVEIAARHLACQQSPMRAVSVAHIGHHFVVQPSALHAGHQLAAQRNRLHPADKGRQLPGVGANIANRARPGERRIATPARLFIVGLFQSFTEPPLQVLHFDTPDIAQLARRNPRPGFAHHRQGAVIMGKDKPAAAIADCFRQRPALVQADAERLIADDVDTAFKKRLRHRHMQMVRGDDRHHINAVLPRRFALRHLLPAGVTAIRGDKKRCAGARRHVSAG